MRRPSQRQYLTADRLARVAFGIFGQLLGEQAPVVGAQVIPAFDGRMTDALALSLMDGEGQQRIEADMKRVNLKLNISATLVDAETGNAEATPFKGDMDFEYNGVPYADALDVQESFAQALNEHGARMIAKGRKRAESLGQK